VSRRFLFTIDADWVPGSAGGLELLLDLCAELGLRPTLFTTGKFALAHPALVRRAAQQGGEVGVHGWAHPMPAFRVENYRFTPVAQRRRWLEQATAAVADVLGHAPGAFRAPYLWIDAATLDLLQELGYRVDSSVPARRFDGLVGMINHLDYFRASLDPYHPDPRAPARRGASALVEVPPSAYVLPLNMSTLRMLGLRWTLRLARVVGRRASVLNFYCHPWEFVDSAHLAFPPGTPARHTGALGPHLLHRLRAFVDRVEAAGYRPGTVSEVATCAS
jgi:peptidoglycan/xylan/chitin deacetylase (PgdA/CDA1 family)